MNNLSDNQKKLIDKYYEEDEDAVVSDSEFQDKLTTALLNMDLPIDATEGLPNNFFEVINRAELIKTKRSLLKETIMFIIIASLILFIFSVSVLIIGRGFLIIIELIIFLLMPFSLIPLAKNAVNRGGTR